MVMDEDLQKPSVKQKVDVKRIKKKANLNISRGNLPSGSKKFNFLNASVQKQTLRANNRALAQNLARARQDLRTLSAEHQELKVSYQSLIQELNQIKRLVGAKDEEVEEEVQRRMRAHVKEMREVLEGLTQNMLQSSHYINTLNDKFTSLSRRSTDSSRTDSLGNVSTSSDGQGNKPIYQRHTAALRNKAQNSLMMKYLSSANEFSPPPFTDNQPLDAEKANMSIIVEQSFMQEESVPISSTLSKQMTTVSENEPETKSSKLPQRVLKGKNSEDSTKSITSDKNIGKPCSKENVNEEHQNIKMKPSQKEHNRKSIDGKQDKENASIFDDELEILDINDEFAELVSASPIAKEPPKDKAEMEQRKGPTDNKKEGRQTIVSNKGQEKSVTNKKAVSKAESKPSKLSKVKSTGKPNKTMKKTPVTSTNTERSPRVIMADIPVEDGSFNPFKPTRTLVRSPVKVGAPSIEIQGASPEQKVDSTKFLASLKKPGERSCKIVNLGTGDESGAEPSNFIDENTIYFNLEMELTTVCGIGKLLQSSKVLSEKSPSQQSENTEVKKQGNDLNPEEELKVAIHEDKSAGKIEINADKKEKTTSGDVETNQQVAGEAPAVEMRNKKPGIFTFSVSRKEADGTRKPVPENSNRSRSKKAIKVTPEKEERNLGADRDMFNFGDRTPTVPLEKLILSKNVYDLSMNDSSIAPTSSLSDFRNGVQVSKSDQQQRNDHIYSVPLKGSPDGKQELKPKGRSRSKSSTRSKSKSRQRNDSDDEWVPSKGRSRSRSSVRQKKPLDSDESPDGKPDFNPKGRSRSKSSTRSKSKTRQRNNSNDELVLSKGRSRSRGIVCRKRDLDSNATEIFSSGIYNTNTEEQHEEQKDICTENNLKDEHIYSVPVKGSPGDKTKDVLKSQSRSKSRTRSKSRQRQGEDSDVESVPVRKSRSRCKKVSAKEFNKELLDTSDDEPDLKISNSRKGEQRDVYYVPLKGSPDRKVEKEIMRTRSRSRGRSARQSKKSSDEHFKTDGHEDEAVHGNEDKAMSTHKNVKDREFENGGKGSTEQSNEHIYTVPLKDSPDEKIQSKSKSRSKLGRTGSKSVTSIEDDSVGEILVGRNFSSRSKARLEDESRQIQTFGENNVIDTDRENGNADGDEVSAKSTTLKAKGSVSSKSLKNIINSPHHSEDNIVSATNIEDFEFSEAEKKQSNKENEHKSTKDSKVDSTEDTSDKNKPGTHNEKCYPETHSTYKVPLKDGSNSTTINKRTRSKSKGHQIAQEGDKIKNDKNPEIVSDLGINKSEKETYSNTNSSAQYVDVVSATDTAAKTLDYVESDFNFVNKSRSRKPKLNETFEFDDDDDDLCDFLDPKSEELSSTCKKGISDDKSVTDVNIRSKTPKTTTSKTLKSVKKRTEKKKTSTSKKGEERQNSRQCLDLDLADSDTAKRSSTKTPATTKVSSKASSMSKSSKSTVSTTGRKRAVESKVQDQTPRIKKDKQDSLDQKENDPSGMSSVEMLKKRLTLVTSRHSRIDPVDPDGSRRKRSSIGLNEELDSSTDRRKRSSIGLNVKEELDDDDQSDGAKRSRRTKNNVSYVPKPLNAKLRRGDSLFDGSSSKAKALEIRLQLAKKTGILKHVKN